MEKLNPKKKLALIRLYLSGLPYREIAVKGGVSNGTVVSVVAELKAGAFPEASDTPEQIELLRGLSLELRRSGMSPGQCAVGLAVLNRIKECGLDAADIGRWPLILKAAGSEEQAGEFVSLVYRIQEVQERSGLTLEDAHEKLHALEAKAAQLEPATREVEERRKELAELTRQRDDLAPVVNNLNEKHELLNPRVKDLEKREGELARRIKERESAIDQAEATLAALGRAKRQLQSAGFSIEALAEFNERTRAIAARHRVPITQLRERLVHELETLDKGLGLETLGQKKEAELRQCQQAVASVKKEQEVLKATISMLEQQRAALEASIKATREKVVDEIARIVPAAREAVRRLGEELQLGNKETLDDLRRMKEEALEIGKEIGRSNGVIEANAWLMELLSLARGEDDLEPRRVRAILLVVLRGAQPWMKRNQASRDVATPRRATETLIGDLEQWRT